MDITKVAKWKVPYESGESRFDPGITKLTEVPSKIVQAFDSLIKSEIQLQTLCLLVDRYIWGRRSLADNEWQVSLTTVVNHRYSCYAQD